MADTDAKPVNQDELVADIDRTRAQLARTIDAIADRVSPKKNFARAVEQARERADRAIEQARQRADRAIEQARERADRAITQARQQADRAIEQVRQHASQVDPVMAGTAAAAFVVVGGGVTVLVVWHRRSR